MIHQLNHIIEKTFKNFLDLKSFEKIDEMNSSLGALIIFKNSEFKIELIPFLCKIEAGEIQLNEHKQIRWVSFGELEKLKLSTPDKMLIQQVENRSILEKYAGKNVHNTG